MKRNRFFATNVADYLELPNSSRLLCSYSSCSFGSLNNIIGENGLLLSGTTLHTPRKSQRFYVGRWLTALCLSLGPVTSYAQASDYVQRDTVRGAARVAYAINYDKVSPHFAENSQELGKINSMIDLLLADSTATLQRVVIRGYGSPDGRYAFNERLARQRTENLKAYVAKHAKLPESLIKVEYVAEDWAGLTDIVEKVSQKDMPHRDEVLKVIMSRQQPDEKERIIRNRYPADFLYLKNSCLPKLRRADYSIEYLTRNSAVAAKSSAVVSINSEPVSGGEASTTTSMDSSSVAATVPSTVTAKATAADLQQKQAETVQEGSRGSSDRLMLWLAIIAGLLLLLLLAAFLIRNLYLNLHAKDENLKRLHKDLNYYRSEIQRLEAEKSALAGEGASVVPVVAAVASAQPEEKPAADEPAVTEEPVAEEPTIAEEPEVAPVVVAAPVIAPIPTPAPKVEQPQPAVEPLMEAPVVAQNSEISSKNEKSLKFESFEGGDSDDFERFKLMDQKVTEQKLFLNADINRRNLMRIAGVDKNRFALMMRNCANTNFAGYINSKRMEYALQLLKEHPEYTMKNIAETCGFSSQSTFFRVFKSIYGVTPTEFSQTGSLPKKGAELPSGAELPKSQ